jgi:2'-5' RNA ligase
MARGWRRGRKQRFKARSWRRDYSRSGSGGERKVAAPLLNPPRETAARQVARATSRPGFQFQPYVVRLASFQPRDSSHETRAMNALSAQISHKSALALIPPSTITAPIEAVRRRHDRHFWRWPPHVNLLFPFLASPSEVIEQGDGKSSSLLNKDIRRRIRNAVQPIQPFRISLSADPPGIYTHPHIKSGKRTRKVVLLQPLGSSIYRLQAALQAEFTEYKAERAYSPYLSVGQVTSYRDAQDIAEETKRTVSQFVTSLEPKPRAVLDWYIDKVFILERQGIRAPYKVVGTVELGSPGS